MGQVCSGTKSEANKQSAFQATNEDADLLDYTATASLHNESSQRQQAEAFEPSAELQEQQMMKRTNSEEGERLKALREEQARLDMIVTAAGRGMVAVRSTRGSTGYYDQGFAAALAQHLEQTTTFPETLQLELPKPSTAESLYNRLSQEPATANPPIDNVAETLLDTIIPGKQHLFARVHPIVETLL